MSHRYQQSGDYDTPYHSVGQYGQPDYGSSANLAGKAAGYEHTYPAASPSGAYKSAAAAKPWYKKPIVLWGVPILLVAIIAGAVAGGVIASKSSDSDSSSSSGSSSSANGSGNRGSGVQNNAAAGLDATALNSYGNPIYATGTSSGQAPAATGTTATCTASTPQYSTGPSGVQVRTDHPVLMADIGKWDCLHQLVEQDAYMKSWNASIMQNATEMADGPTVTYDVDGGLGGSGVLDVARSLKVKTKAWGYAWRVTGDMQWPNRAWQELLVASGNSSTPFGADDGTRWNPTHFLDVAEFTAAFAYAYDWMYDAWTEDQRTAIRGSITQLGLRLGLQAYNGAGFGWFTQASIQGNWACVCNGGLTLGALAIANEDTSGMAQQILGHSISNAHENCVMAVRPDGTWAETSDYWYFGSTGHAEMTSALITATGDDRGMLSTNTNFNKTGLFHMYGTGFVEKFNYGDCGPNKYSATANCMMLYGREFNIPMYSLYQRDRADAARDPLSMLWYDANLSGDWWADLPLDHYFNHPNTAWSSMRSSWTDNNGIYAAMKAGNSTDHQTHGNLDAGDFVFEALGQRWAGELCHENYLAPGYFSNEDQDSQRWQYYRCGTQGQNTLLLNGANQIVDQSPSTNYDSTGEGQTALTFSVPDSSTAYFWSDLSSTYGGTDIKRGMRLVNGRRQFLIQDEINGSANPAQWRMHTNATISLGNGNRQATMTLNGATMIANILGSAPSVTFGTAQTTPTGTVTSPPSGGTNSPNPGVSVLTIDVPAGSTTLEVLFNPQWDGMAASAYATPSSVPLSSWSLTSHN